MPIKISKDLARFIKATCKDEGLDRTKYINKLLWNGIKLDIKQVAEEIYEQKEEKNSTTSLPVAKRLSESDENEFSRGIF